MRDESVSSGITYMDGAGRCGCPSSALPEHVVVQDGDSVTGGSATSPGVPEGVAVYPELSSVGMDERCGCGIVYRSVYDRLCQQLYGHIPPGMDTEDILRNVFVWRRNVELVVDEIPATFRLTDTGGRVPKTTDIIYYREQYYNIGGVTAGANGTYICDGCIPLDAAIIEVYRLLVDTIIHAENGEQERIAGEEARNAAEGSAEHSVPGDGSRWGTFKQSELDREHEFNEAEATRAENERTRQYNEEDRKRHENNRVSAEQERVAAEQERERVSASDHAQYESDHGGYVQDHQNAEDDHARAESDHTRAEQDHSIVQSSVLFTPQILTDEQKAQARENIGAESGGVGQLVEPITYEDLKAKRDAGELTPGLSYRITDYVATTIQANTRSANHPFDIIVRAISENEFAEEAKAIIHEGDTYFSSNGANLSAWKVWYAIDNDATRFTWADSENGRGVVYRLVDEWGNDLPYDFKGIQFKRFKITATNSILSNINNLYVGLPGGGNGYTSDANEYKWYYTFSLLGNTFNDEIVDASIYVISNQNNVVLDPRCDARPLSNIVFANGKALYDFLKSINANTANEANVVAVNTHMDEGSINISSFGTFGNNFMQSQFRNSTFVVGKLTHTTFQSDFQNNTIVATRHFMTSDIGVYFADNIIYSEIVQGTSIDSNFKNNIFNLVGNCGATRFSHNFQNNTFSGVFSMCSFDAYMARNTFTDVDLAASSFDGQFTDNRFSGIIRGCSFGGYLSYVMIPSVQSTGFFNIDVMGSVRGSSSSMVELDYSQFRRANATGVSKRVRIEGDNNGKIVATWYDSGKRVGVTKSVGDASWTELPDYYVKPTTGIPASDLASGVIPDVSQFITKSVNDLTNYYLKSETYTQAEVNALIGAIQQFHYEIYASTSAVTDPATNVLYLIGPTGSGADKYEEYVYASGSFVKIGDTSIDLSGYVTTTALNTALADYTATANLAAVALSGSYNDLLNKPTIPAAQIQSDWSQSDNTQKDFIKNKPSTDTFVKSYPGVTSKLATTTVPNVTSIGAASTWSFAMGTGDHAHALVISGGNGSAPTLGAAKTVATGDTNPSGSGATVMCGLGEATRGDAYVNYTP